MLSGLHKGSAPPASLADRRSAPKPSAAEDLPGVAKVAGRQKATQHRPSQRLLAKAVSSSSTPARCAHKSVRLAVFVSGGGSNFKAIHKSLEVDQVPATVEAVVSDNPSCGGCRYAFEVGIAVLHYPVAQQASPSEDSADRLRRALVEEHEIDYVLLAGYLKLVPAAVVAAFPRAMLNIHPSLLPAFGGRGFYGSKVHQAVIKSGARFTGPTVHFVDDKYDSGPILAQRVIPVNPLEDHKQLAARVLNEEHKLYPAAVAALVEKRIGWREDGVPIIWSPS